MAGIVLAEQEKTAVLDSLRVLREILANNPDLVSDRDAFQQIEQALESRSRTDLNVVVECLEKWESRLAHSSGGR